MQQDDRTFVYVIEIATTPEKLWAGLISNEFWGKFSGPIESDWKTGSPVKFFSADGNLYSEGKILESRPPHTLSHTWPEPKGERTPDKPPLLTWTISPGSPGKVKLTLVHDHLSEKSFQGVSSGWPTLIANLRNSLEPGRVPQIQEK